MARGAGIEPWTATIWPLGRESFCAAGLETLLRDEGSPTDVPFFRRYPEVLLDPDTPLGPMARLLLGVTLSSKLPELHAVWPSMS